MMKFINNCFNITQTTSSYRFRLIFNAYKKWFKKNDRVLDVGCGTGIITKLFMDTLPTMKIVGCDIKNNLLLDIPFTQITDKNLPFAKNSFDVVLLNDVLHHIPFQEQENLLMKSIKVAKKIFIFDAKPTILGKITDVILNKYHYGNLEVPLSFRNVEDWQKLFKKLSLRSEEVNVKKTFWYPFSRNLLVFSVD